MSVNWNEWIGCPNMPKVAQIFKNGISLVLIISHSGLDWIFNSTKWESNCGHFVPQNEKINSEILVAETNLWNAHEFNHSQIHNDTIANDEKKCFFAKQRHPLEKQKREKFKRRANVCNWWAIVYVTWTWQTKCVAYLSVNRYRFICATNTCYSIDFEWSLCKQSNVNVNSQVSHTRSFVLITMNQDKISQKSSVISTTFSFFAVMKQI